MKNSTLALRSHTGIDHIRSSPPHLQKVCVFSPSIFSPTRWFSSFDLTAVERFGWWSWSIEPWSKYFWAVFCSGFLFGWWKLKYVRNVHPDFWGDDPIRRAYFSYGLGGNCVCVCVSFCSVLVKDITAIWYHSKWYYCTFLYFIMVQCVSYLLVSRIIPHCFWITDHIT